MTANATSLQAGQQALLNLVQERFPLTVRPFQTLAEVVGLDEDAVIACLTAAREAGVLRQISAIFDTAALGYRSSLVAMRVAPERLTEAAAAISAHPGVSHNYQRQHDFNLWFTIAVPANGSLEWTVDRLSRRAGQAPARLLPALKVFKIGVSFDMTGERPADARSEATDGERAESPTAPLSDLDIRVVRALQDDIALTREPFARPAAVAGVSQEALLAAAQRLESQGYMRRFAAVLHHRRAGFTANAMTVWAVPEAGADEVGRQMASFQAVSHCYQRPAYPDWPFNLFTMIHARSSDECEATAAAIEAATSIHERAMLYSTTEFKKVRLRYFTEELDGWEERERRSEEGLA